MGWGEGVLSGTPSLPLKRVEWDPPPINQNHGIGRDPSGPLYTACVVECPPSSESGRAHPLSPIDFFSLLVKCPSCRIFQVIQVLHLTKVHAGFSGLGGDDLVLSTDSDSMQIS